MFVKSVWMHWGDLGNSVEDVVKTFSRLRDHGFSKAFLFVKSRGDVIYPTKHEARFAMEGWEGGDPLEETVKVAHQMGIEVHATFVVFCEGTWKGWGVPSEPGYWLSKHMDLVQIGRFRGPPSVPSVEKLKPILRWADPAKEEVRTHEKNLILEVVENYDVDGVQLDYIRYPEEAEGCLCNHCREVFKGLYGIDPKEIEKPNHARSLWVQWRAQNITSFVEELRLEMRRISPETALSAAVFKDYPRCLVAVGQDWPRWVDEGLVDFICPMTYEYDLKVARYLAKNHRAAVGGGATIYEGLGKRSSQSILSPEEVRAQAEAFKSEGANGITIFSNSALTDEDLTELDKV